MRRILASLTLLCLLLAGIGSAQPSQASSVHATAPQSRIIIRNAAPVTSTLLGPGTYANVSQTTAPWQPPACEFISISVNQINTTGPGQTATLVGTFLSSQDGKTWSYAGDFGTDVTFTDITTLNKNGVLRVPPTSVFGTAYAPYLKVQFQLTGTVAISSVVLSTN